MFVTQGKLKRDVRQGGELTSHQAVVESIMDDVRKWAQLLAEADEKKDAPISLMALAGGASCEMPLAPGGLLLEDGLKIRRPSSKQLVFPNHSCSPGNIPPSPQTTAVR